MPPLGVGVNFAMLDASDLALALANSPTVEEAIRARRSDLA
jgi:2-polyprenyl-6-methoxyphenol hydroxylase-like FAD-dependent oxidoreductase